MSVQPASPQCPTCAFNELERYKMRGVWTEGRRCRKAIVSFPDATHCPYYEREAGVD